MPEKHGHAAAPEETGKRYVGDAYWERDSVDEILGRMRSAMKVANDAELARALKISRATISSWRKRGNIPLGKILHVAQQSLSSIETLYTGRAGLRTHDVNNVFAYPLALWLYEHCRNEVSILDRWRTVSWWAQLFPHIVQYYEFEIFQVADAEDIDLEEATRRLRDAISETRPADLIDKLEALFLTR